MNRLRFAVLPLLILAGLIAPSRALAAGTTKTTGAMTTTDYGIRTREVCTYRWEWTAVSPASGGARQGHLSLTVSYVAPDGSTAIDYAKTVDVLEVTRVASGVVEFTTSDRTPTPGDPSWGDARFRAVDNGATGDELQQYDMYFYRFSPIARDGRIVDEFVPDLARLGGPDRLATAVAISRHAFPGKAASVVIADGYNFPDALAAAPMARLNGGPVILVAPTVLRGDVLAELRRLAPSRIFIAGGTRAVSGGVEAALRRLPSHPAVTRFAGADRFDTAARIAEAVRVKTGTVGKAVVVNGYDYHDGLLAAPLAAAKGWPLLLTAPAALPRYTSAELGRLRAPSTLVVGDTSDVRPAVYSRLKAPYRIAETDHYACGCSLLDYAKAQGVSPTHVALAVGTNFPDALAAGAYLGRDGGLLLFTRTAALPFTVRTHLAENKVTITTLDAMGEKAAVSDTAVGQALSALK